MIEYRVLTRLYVCSIYSAFSIHCSLNRQSKSKSKFKSKSKSKSKMIDQYRPQHFNKQTSKNVIPFYFFLVSSVKWPKTSLHSIFYPVQKQNIHYHPTKIDIGKYIYMYVYQALFVYQAWSRTHHIKLNSGKSIDWTTFTNQMYSIDQ